MIVKPISESELLQQGVPFTRLDNQYYVTLSVFCNGQPCLSAHWPFLVADLLKGPTPKELRLAAKTVIDMVRSANQGELQFVEGLHFLDGQDVFLEGPYLLERKPVPYILAGNQLSGFPVPSMLSMELVGSPVEFEDLQLTEPRATLDLEIEGTYRFTLWPKSLRHKPAEFTIDHKAQN